MRPLRFLRPAHSPVAVVHAMSRAIEGRTILDDRAESVVGIGGGRTGMSILREEMWRKGPAAREDPPSGSPNSGEFGSVTEVRKIPGGPHAVLSWF